ncbi:MAG: response regulator [Saprospiraceae bacterium]|nr:response regulator [Saprospiraceae bacterium]
MAKILVIEDNHDVRDNIAEILELSGYEVVTAEDGKKGVSAALQNSPDLILCDIMMPELDGFGVLRILGKNPVTAGVPFIFLTAKAEKDDFRRGMGLGADDYITKPFDDVSLLDTIELRMSKSKRLRTSFDGSEQGVHRFLREAKAQEELLELTENRESRTYQKRDEIYREGQTALWLFFVVSGRIKTFQTNDMGKELITHIYGPGEFLGYLPLINDQPYSDSADAIEEARLLLIPKEDFQQLLFTNKEISATLIRMLARQVSETEEHLLQLAYGSVREKVAGALMTLYDKYNDGSTARISLLREDLANMAGTAKETVIRTLSDFKDEGHIEIVGSDIVINDISTLRNMPY